MNTILINKFAILITLLFSFSVGAASQTLEQAQIMESPPQAAISSSATETRIRQLEEQVRSLQDQMNKLIGAATNTPRNDAKAAKKESDPKLKQVNAPTVETKTKQRSLGVDVGSARLIPFGTIYFNAFSNSGGTNNADVPLFASPTGNANTGASVRQTRLGIRLEGMRVGSANMKAILEADFFGGFPSITIGENFGVVRLRLANARLDWEKTSATFGQDWMPFAPVNPTSLAAAAIPQLAAGGNMWARIPQIKVERKLGSNLTIQGALLAPQTGDHNTISNFFLQPSSGALSRVPFFQSRIAFAETNWLNAKKPGSIGLSGHYGRSKVLTGATSNIKNDIDSFGIALDWSFPVTERISLAGETFFGRNLSGFQGGVFQGYNNDFAYRVGSSLVSGGVRPIRTRGGWTQIGFTLPFLNDRMGIYGSIGIDDPNDEDLVSLSHRDWRTRNLTIAADAIYKLTTQFSIGAEFRRFQTNYFYSSRQNANHVNLAAAYTF